MLHQPTFSQFVELAKKSSLVTVYRRLANDSLTPVTAFYSIDNGRNTFLFESVIGGENLGRYSFVGNEPLFRFEAIGRKASITPGVLPPCAEWTPEGVYQGPGDPLNALENLMSHFNAEHIAGLPRFCGGAVGYVGYDAVRYTENLPNAPRDDRCLPDVAFDIYDSIIIFDHLQKTITVTANAHVLSCRPTGGNGKPGHSLWEAYEAACQRVDSLVKRLKRQVLPPLPDVDLRPGVKRGFDKCNFEEKGTFERVVNQCKEYIAAGDIFQVVISQRFETESSASPFSVYRALRVLNPSPFMFYVRMGPTCLVGSSPEVLVKVEDNEITIRPLAGTRRRGDTEKEDDALAAELLADPKERAEHIMLVDLGRNDVGRVANYSTVKLSDTMTVERYSHVMHITTNITGQLADGKNAFQWWPGGAKAKDDSLIWTRKIAFLKKFSKKYQRHHP